MEQRLPIKGFEGLYEVSNLGNVRGLVSRYGLRKEPRLLKPRKDTSGYSQVKLCGRTFMVHRLVAQVFIPNPENKSDVNHKDLLKSNNNVDNLERTTHKENIQDFWNKLGRVSKLGIDNKNSKKVYQYTLSGDFIKMRHSLHDITRELGLSYKGISNCCRGKCKRIYGYIRKY